MQTLTLEQAVALLEQYLDPLHEGNCTWDVFGEEKKCLRCDQAEQELRRKSMGFVLDYRSLKRGK